MSKQLFEHINNYVTVNETDFQDIMTFFSLQNFGKKEIVAEAGLKCNFNHFVSQGCIHMYFIDDRGSHSTVQFAIENWWLTDDLAFMNRTTTDFYIQAVEETQLLSISYENQEILLTRYPQLEKYFRTIYQRAFGSSIRRIKYLYDFSKEEVYFHFTEHFPEFAQRVPQYLIASFLGLTPEYVSEIRSKKRS